MRTIAYTSTVLSRAPEQARDRVLKAVESVQGAFETMCVQCAIVSALEQLELCIYTGVCSARKLLRQIWWLQSTISCRMWLSRRCASFLPE
jgi:hypothetical protein